MYNEAVERGWLRAESWDAYGQARVLVDQPQITADTIYRFERLFNRRFYLRRKFARRMLKRSLNPRHLRDYALAVPYLLVGTNADPLAGKWDCWENIQEEHHLDLRLPEPDIGDLSYVIRTRGIPAK